MGDTVVITNAAMRIAIDQAQETLRHVKNNQQDYNAYQVLTHTGVTEARLSRDNQRVRTIVL